MTREAWRLQWAVARLVAKSPVGMKIINNNRSQPHFQCLYARSRRRLPLRTPQQTKQIWIECYTGTEWRKSSTLRREYRYEMYRQMTDNTAASLSHPTREHAHE